MQARTGGGEQKVKAVQAGLALHQQHVPEKCWANRTSAH